jgi:hypothetical protein
MKAFREHMQHPALLPPRCRAGSGNDGSGNTGSDVMGTSAMTPVVANNCAAGGENFGHRPGDEFLEGYCSATESPALSKGKFLDRIRSGEVKAMEEAHKEHMELEHLANENGLPVPLPLSGGVQVQTAVNGLGAATSARGGVSPASYLMQFADRANQLSKMVGKAKHEAADKAAGDKTAGGGTDKAAAGGGVDKAAAAAAVTSCVNCGKVPGGGLPLRYCGVCKVPYCGSACQASHWPRHKLTCRSQAEERKREGRNKAAAGGGCRRRLPAAEEAAKEAET